MRLLIMMTFKFSLFILPLLLIIYSDNLYSECVEGKIKHIFKNEEIITNENYCYELNPMILLSTKSCTGVENCKNISLGQIELRVSERSLEIGSLGFKICDKFGGKPQIMEFWALAEWHSASRCIFDDGSFIDISTLAQKVKFLDY